MKKDNFVLNLMRSITECLCKQSRFNHKTSPYCGLFCSAFYINLRFGNYHLGCVNVCGKLIGGYYVKTRREEE